MKSFPTAIALVFWLNAVALSAEWPQFRGPDGQGHAEESNLPLTWSETEHVTWKVPIAGLGWSSPSISGQQVWLTSALDEGHSLHAICVDLASGTQLHDVEVFHLDDPGSIHSKNSHASPTPIIEGDRVYLHFGKHGTACISTAGEIVWKTQELQYEHRHGPGGSPVLYQDLLIISCDGTDVQFVVALDKRTGQIRWKKERAGQMAYSTPLVVQVDGVDQVVSTGGERVVAYAPLTGDEIWSTRYDGYSEVPRPVAGHGLVFVCTGYNEPSVYAIRLGGSGDITDTHVAWSLRRGAPHNPSPLLLGEELYLVSDRGIASCLDARSGKEHWQERVKGNYSASPLNSGQRIYFLNEEGLTTVIEAGTKFKELATNQLQGRTLASIAVADHAILIRTDTHLYRIEDPR